MKKEILEKTAREYYTSAEEESKKQRYNSATVLYFKAIISLIDLYLYITTGTTPSNHGERFRKIKEKNQEIYDILDKDFPFYQDSYNQIMTKELAEVIKKDAQELAKRTGTELF